ncbi:vWA domain-containing protein [Thermoflavimicrobium dichotomicum]|uniref:Uncharacterized conserved protein YegL, contains vWA domain of TerY type n=1 Tax=Thermoflavimicrobium dichotomicum TaxID=46223 RepID=A0A1I3R8C5_9BACL|nr:VWA domain-containing protein [Thermoflavimicrobium dichotomicum]SFJ42884.1 Uncharacterized conserved protein YegL, contains vWA domain of TerY type [Thermoflavimicrobium dichotomicum]
MDDLFLQHKELIENPTARVPICLVLDRSGSMSGEPIAELNKGVQLFIQSIRRDDIAAAAAEIAIVSFGDEAPRKELDFGSIERQKVPYLTASGLTPMGAAVNMALDMLELRKKMYQQTGVDYYQPWMVLMTDGAPTDDITQAAERSTQLALARKLTVFPIGIGPHADLSALKQFSPRRDPARLKGLNFSLFFEWLSKSVSAVSQSTPGERIPLPKTGGWDEL